ncbi:unnamed protein product, partial [Coregonus sp. 'balchen']
MGAHRGEGRRDWLQQDAVEQPPIQTMNPWNIMIKHRQLCRRGRRSQMTMNYTDPVISMDLLRTSKQLFSDGKKATVTRTGPEPPVKRAKLEDESSQRTSPVPKKRKGRTTAPVGSYDKPTTYSNVPKPKTSESIKRQGPKWDPSRLNEGSRFVLGSRANKALGMGGTRGRIYIKHTDLFKYAADAQDKHWLAERQHMRATGGKMAYLLIEEDVQDLSLSNDYKDCPDLKMTPVELKPFTVP